PASPQAAAPAPTPQAATPPKAEQGVPMTLSGQGGAGGGAARVPAQRMTPQQLDNKIKADLARRRAGAGR
ncbi:MAG: hypothetical protein VW547_10555, partial [Alphaproteobacteria bacterium]